MEKNTLFVKITFFEQINQIYGYMLLIFDSQKGLFSQVTYILSLTSQEISSSLPWQQVHEKIASLMEKIREDEKLYYLRNTLDRYYKEKYPESKLRKLQDIARSSGDRDLRNVLLRGMFMDDLSGIMKSKKLDFQIDSEVLSETAEKNQDSIPAPIQVLPEQNPPVSGLDSINLKVNPVIDPVDGKYANSFKKGDLIYVKIIDDSPVGIHVARSITGSETPEKVEVQGQILSLAVLRVHPNTSAPDIIIITVSLEKSIFGVFEAQIETKIRSVKETISEQTSTSSDTSQKTSLISEYSWIFGIAAVLLLILLLLLTRI